jgi:NaMN:DMB phosphoribosyltransferase
MQRSLTAAKPKLHRQTVRELTAAELPRAAGGIGTSTTVACPTTNTDLRPTNRLRSRRELSSNHPLRRGARRARPHSTNDPIAALARMGGPTQERFQCLNGSESW